MSPKVSQKATDVSLLVDGLGLDMLGCGNVAFLKIVSICW